jgi:hypothetical protein
VEVMWIVWGGWVNEIRRRRGWWMRGWMQLPNYGSWRRAALRYVDETLRSVPRLLRAGKSNFERQLLRQGEMQAKGSGKEHECCNNVPIATALRTTFASPNSQCYPPRLSSFLASQPHPYPRCLLHVVDVSAPAQWTIAKMSLKNNNTDLSESFV